MVRSRIVALTVAVGVAGCGMLGVGEITVDAINETAEPMVVQVVEGVGPDAPPFGPAHTVAPGETRPLELAVPGGDWAIVVNDGELLGSLDAGLQRGRLPVTLILSDDGPHWQAPPDWAATDS